MFKIRKNEISINRGDIASIKLKIPMEEGFYEFQPDDVITFGVYEPNKYHKEAVILKEIVVEEPTEKVTIELTSEDTRIGELINEPIPYWYEIQLNHEQTIIGYDDKGAKYFNLYPEGSDIYVGE